MKVRFLKDVITNSLSGSKKKDGRLFVTSLQLHTLPLKGKIFEAVESGEYIMIRYNDDRVLLPKDDSFEILTEEEERIYNIHLQTGFDEITIGCYLSNYRLKHVCPPFNNGWCKDYEKCKVLERVVADMMKEKEEK